MKNIIILLSLLAAGCAGQVSGVVYLDQNGNELRDPNEKGLGNIMYSVTLDGTLIKNGITNEDGSFEFNKDKTGYYCVIAKKNSGAIAGDKASVAAKAATSSVFKAVAAAPAPTITGVAVVPSTGNAQVNSQLTITLTANQPGLSVGQCTVNSVSVVGSFVDKGDNTYTLKYTVGTNDASWTAGNLPISCKLTDPATGLSATASSWTDVNTLAGSTGNGAAAPSQPATQPPLVDSAAMKACASGEGYSSNLTLLVAVKQEFQNSLMDFSVPNQTVNINEEFNLNIFYPKSCKLQKLWLPPYVAYKGSANKVVDLDSIVPNFSQSVQANDISEDELLNISVPLKVTDKSADGQNIEFEPKIICPDGSSPSLPKQTVTVKWTPNIAITQNIEVVEIGANGQEIPRAAGDPAKPPKPGDKIILTGSIKNNGVLAYSNAKLTVKLPPASTLESAPGCNQQVEQVECTGTIEAKNTRNPKKYTIQFLLPARIDNDTKFTIYTELDSVQNDVLGQDEISFTVLKPADAVPAGN